jgi:hypothetical protein
MVTALNLRSAVTEPPHDADKSEVIHTLTSQIAPKLDKNVQVYVDTPDPTGGVETLWMLPAIVLQLERQGFEVHTTDPRFTWREPRGGELPKSVVSIHRVSPDAPTVPRLAAIPPAATASDIIIWVERG